MLELTEVAKWLTDRLNEKGLLNTPIYSFNINAEVGKNKGEDVVNGILYSETPKITPIPNVKDYKYKLRVTLSVTAPTANYNLKNVEKIIGDVAETYNGKEIEFANGKGLITFSLTGTKDFKIDAGQGGIVPISFYIDINYVEGLITSSGKVWKLDGLVIPFLSESVIIEKNGRTNPINDRRYQQTFMTNQMKWYHFRFPYTDSELCTMLQKDILDGDMNKRYTLTYYDGVSYTEANPYTTTVVLFRNGDTDSQRPDTAMFDVMFADADDGKSNVKFEMALLSTPFDSSTDNTRWFDSELDQKVWYNTQILAQNLRFCEIPAPNLNSLYLTNQVYQNIVYDKPMTKPSYADAIKSDYTSSYYYKGANGNYIKITSELTESEYDNITDVYLGYYNLFYRCVNQNKAVIRVVYEKYSYGFFSSKSKPEDKLTAAMAGYVYVDNNGYFQSVGGLTNEQYNNDNLVVYDNKKYFIYDITNAEIGADNQIIVDLKLDTVQTYMFQENDNVPAKPMLDIKGSFIEKAHLDRWIYSYELINTDPLQRPSLVDCLTYGYYKKNPDTATIESGDTFTLITPEIYNATGDRVLKYVYEMALRFNGKADSKLFEREDIRELSKRLVNRQKLQFYTGSGFTIVSPKPAYSSLSSGIYYYKVNNEYKPLYQPIYEYNPETSETTVTNAITEQMYNNILEVYETSFYGRVVNALNGYTCWIYAFVDSGSYNVLKKGYSSTQSVTLNLTESETLKKMNLSTAILCFPFDLDSQHDNFVIEDYNSQDAYVNVNGWLDFINLNPNLLSDHLKGVKLSLKPPINILGLGDYNFDENRGVDIFFNPTDKEADIVSLSKYLNVKNLAFLRTGSVSAIRNGIFYLQTEYENPVPLRINEDISQFGFKKTDIVGQNRNKKFNPKMNEQDYRSLNLTINGNAFEMPINKINLEKPVFEYFEQLTPEITKGLLRFKSYGLTSLTDVFNEYYSQSFNGFSYQDNFTIAVAYNAYAQYIASNKNAYEQLNAQLSYNEKTTELTNKYAVIKGATGAATGLASGVGSILSGDIGKGMTELFGGAQKVVDTASTVAENRERVELNMNYEKTKFDLSIDNMKNAPTTLRNINGNAILTNMIAEFGIYAEILEGLDTELESANDVMFRDGYNLNRFEESGKTIRDYCHTRKYFNYIRATLGNISGIPVSNAIRDNLRQRFSNGIRFWHQDTIDYSKENYELKIEQ